MKGKNRHITLEQVYDMDNLRKADKEARKGKAGTYGVRKFDRDREGNLLKIRQQIMSRTYHTSTPKLEERFCDKKVRVLCKVTYYDHVAHHALMQVIMPVLNRTYYYESAASIKGRGIHYLLRHVRKYIDLHPGPLWWGQIDFVKMYPNFNRQRLYDHLCKEFTNEGIRWMLHDVIWAMGEKTGLTATHIGDGNHGVGTGLYTTQPLVNFDTGPLLRMLAAMPGVKVFCYCDNIVFLGDSPKAVWDAILAAKDYVENEMGQPLHDNIGVQLLAEEHPVDFIGYLLFKDHTLVRKDTKYRFKRKLKNATEEKRPAILASYKGWLKHCDGLHLWRKVTNMYSFSDLNIEPKETLVDGHRFFDVPIIKPSFVCNQKIEVHDYESGCSTKNGDNRTWVKIRFNGHYYKFCTANKKLIAVLDEIDKQGKFPFEATLKCSTEAGIANYYFE